mmetsp:Transcript_9203/g.13822  ORF Transcript_9203/g.13822 Transcript_9203/m.13822 type:complete len:116 (-) Transcript_9203:1-348(-)
MSGVSGDKAAKLFRYVSEVKVILNPWRLDISRSALEVLRRMDTPKHITINPKAIVKPCIVKEPTWPTVKIKFIDGSEKEWQAHKLRAQDIIQAYQFHALEVEMKLEDEGKNIDEM